MKKIEVKILGLSYSQSQSGSYVVVLSAVRGNKKLPVIIKPAEAQQIALKAEGMKSTRPLTHDLFKSLCDSFLIDLQEVLVYSIAEGIFYTKIIANNGGEVVEIESGIGDAIALSISFGCPIYVHKEVMDAAGISMNEEGEVTDKDGCDNSLEDDEDDENLVPVRTKLSVQDLEQMMNDALANEEYEIAAELRDKIAQLKS
jgi:bifunctional DNase/RNase